MTENPARQLPRDHQGAGGGLHPLPGRSLRVRLGRFACAGAGVLVVFMLIPTFTRNLWIARLALSELSLMVIAPLALLGLGGLWRAGDRERGFRWIAGTSLLASLLPVAMTLPAFWTGHRTFAASEYFTWGPFHEPVYRQTDLVLDPSRPDLRLDLYQGLGAGPRPLIVIVHGGSFSGGDKGENRTGSEIFAATGYAVADVQYRLAPAAPFPLAIQDVKCLVGKLRQRATAFNIDPERVAYLGRSAGGAIAIIAAYSAGDPRLPPSCDVPDLPVRAMVSLYSPLDLDWGWRQRPFPDPIVGYRVLERYIGGTPTSRPEAYRLASATSWVGSVVPPTLLIHGTRDSLVSPHHTTLLIDAFTHKGLKPPRRLLIPFADHGFDYHPGGLAEQLARAEILEFLQAALAGPRQAAGWTN